MSKLREFNNYILNEYKTLENKNDLSMPLLIASDENYINSFERKIMYIGQETNCWVNYIPRDFDITSDSLEKYYFDFLKNGATNRDFWLFIKKILNTSHDKIINNVVWNNTLIAGKRMEKGHPVVSEKLSDLSLEYLLFIHDFFKPEQVIFVNGPHNPYYNITIKFLRELKSNLINDYPTKSNPMLIDEENNLIWTYHPNYLNRQHLNNEIVDKIKNKIK